MSEQVSEEGTAAKRDKLSTTIEVAVTMAIITVADFVKVTPGSNYEIIPKVLKVTAPLIGLGISGIITYFVNGYRDDRTETRIKEYIHDLEEEIKNPSTTPDRKIDARQEQILHNQDLIDLRRRRNKRDIV